MSFPRYERYKDSSVEWLGEVPEGWKVTFLKRGYDVVLGKMLQPDPKREQDEYLPYLRAANIQPTGVETSDIKRMWFSPAEKDSLRIQSGDLLVSEGGDVGRSAIWESDDELYFQNSINRIRGVENNSVRFLHYWIISIKGKGYIDVLCNKSTIAHFTAEKVAAVPVPFPTKEEQAQIARFLDHETARIDALIAEQQRLIELLKEKRQAVISHAVTKGLDPTVPMKDSGVEWLGEVPESWNVCQSKHLFESVTSGSRGWAEYYSDDGNLFFRIANLTRDTIEPKLETLQYVSPPIGSEGERSRIIADDILISITADLGSVCVANSSITGGYVSQHVALVRPYTNKADSRWLAYFVLSIACKDQLLGAGYGGTKIQLSLEDIKTFLICVPSYNQQTKIANFLDGAVTKFQLLINEAENGIKFLSERRSALISAAVTGKIDVRNWQPPASVSVESHLEVAHG